MFARPSILQWLVFALWCATASAAAIKRDSFPRPLFARQNSPSSPTPPQAPLLFNQTSASISATCLELAQALNQSLAEIKASARVESVTFESAVLPFANADNMVNNQIRYLSIYYFFVGEPMDALNGCSDLTGTAQDAIFADQQFFDLVNALRNSMANDTSADPEEKTYVERIYWQFNQAGANPLTADQVTEAATLDTELGNLRSSFRNNIKSDTSGVWLTLAELGGVSSSVISTLEVGNGTNVGKFFVPTHSDDFVYETRKALTNHTSRQAVALSYANAAPGNVELLANITSVSQQYAHIFGYSNFAEKSLAKQMAGSPEAVKAFIDNLVERLAPAGAQDIQKLNALYQNETGDSGGAFQWDDDFLIDQSNANQFGFTAEEVSEYYSAYPTLEKVLKFYGDFYSFTFELIDTTTPSPGLNQSILTWYPDVQLYSVWDSTSQEFVGYMYLDLFDRDGKDPDFYMVPGGSSFKKADGTRQYPIAVVAGAFVKSGNGVPTLLNRDSLGAMMHELGHTMHQLSSCVKFARLHGPTSTPTDFMEAPSQLMEHFAWFAPILMAFSNHWSYESPEALSLWQQNNTGTVQPPQIMPDSLAQSVADSRLAFIASGCLEQITYVKYDQLIYTANTTDELAKIEFTLAWNENYKELVPLRDGEDLGLGPRWGHGFTIFRHLAESNYAARYYGYLWSFVYAMDVLYTAGWDQNPFNYEAGKRWRDTVLVPGASKDYYEILTDFLGHAPNQDGFFKDLGLA